MVSGCGCMGISICLGFVKELIVIVIVIVMSCADVMLSTKVVSVL